MLEPSLVGNLNVPLVAGLSSAYQRRTIATQLG